MSLASVDGVISAPERALIPVTDEGLLRGDGAFEVIRLYHGRPFALRDHLARLANTCAGLRLPFDVQAVESDVTNLLTAADENVKLSGSAASSEDSLLRLVMTRGGRRIAIIEPLPKTPPSLKVATVPYSPTGLLNNLKTLSYAANMLAGRIAAERGCDEALFVLVDSSVILEGPTWSFFWVESGRLCTPPLSNGQILASITRARLLEEMEVEEVDCPLDTLDRAEEAFLASTVREVLPIAAIDGKPLPLVGGPITLEAKEILSQRIQRELKEAGELAGVVG